MDLQLGAGTAGQRNLAGIRLADHAGWARPAGENPAADLFAGMVGMFAGLPLVAGVAGKVGMVAGVAGVDFDMAGMVAEVAFGMAEMVAGIVDRVAGKPHQCLPLDPQT